MEKFKLENILHIDKKTIDKLERDMAGITGREGVVEQLELDIKSSVLDKLSKLGLEENVQAEDVVHALTAHIGSDENELYNYIGIKRDDFQDGNIAKDIFRKIKNAAFEITSEKKGFFLKKEKTEEILRKNPPNGTIKYFKYKDVEELLSKQDINEVISALRFTETNEWMHQTFDVAYSDFTSDDFEEREIELRMLGSQWYEIGKKFVAKKHHNVSHLKEFGVIFLNPINQHLPGALFRDFALFFHYFHEIAFYSKLFKRNADNENFSDRLKSLLRGDVPEKDSVSAGEWLIVQKYLWKENEKDPRLFLPRINPEALHWHKGEQNLVEFGKKRKDIGFEFWDNLDWVAAYFPNRTGKKSLISFDLEDNAMSYVSASQKEGEYIRYHQQEALWNELFRRYVGAEELDRLLIENFEKGSIQLG